MVAWGAGWRSRGGLPEARRRCDGVWVARQQRGHGGGPGWAAADSVGVEPGSVGIGNVLERGCPVCRAPRLPGEEGQGEADVVCGRCGRCGGGCGREKAAGRGEREAQERLCARVQLGGRRAPGRRARRARRGRRPGPGPGQAQDRHRFPFPVDRDHGRCEDGAGDALGECGGEAALGEACAEVCGPGGGMAAGQVLAQRVAGADPRGQGGRAASHRGELPAPRVPGRGHGARRRAGRERCPSRGGLAGTG